MQCHHLEPEISPRYLNVNFKTGHTSIIRHILAEIFSRKRSAFFNTKDTAWHLAQRHIPQEGHKHGLNKAQKV